MFAERARSLGLPKSRANLNLAVSDFLAEFSEAYLADLRLAKIAGLAHRVFVNPWTRLLGALDRYREHFPRVEVIAITASPATRLARARARREKSSEAQLTVSQMLADDGLVSERAIPDLMRQATARLENNLDTPDIIYATLYRLMHEWRLARD